MEWFVSVWDEKADVHHYRGGQAPDHFAAIEEVVATGRVIAHGEDGSFTGNVGKVVIDGTPVDAIPFGDLDVSDNQLRQMIAATFDSVRQRTDLTTQGQPRPYLPPAYETDPQRRP